MLILIKECGRLMNWLEGQKEEAQRSQDKEKQISLNMIREYQLVLNQLEIHFKGKQKFFRKYLEIRRARYAVEEGMEMTMPADVLYTWLIQNLCDLEDHNGGYN